MNPDDLARILDELGQRLGPTGEYVFALAVRQVYIEGVVGLSMAAVSLGIGAIVARPLYRWGTSGSSYSSRDIIATLIGLIWGCVAAIFVINAIYQAQRLANPEYAAIRDILGAVGQ
jgi:hypothetical protein